MRQLIALYFLPTIIINLGNVFAFLFQFVLAHALTVGEVGVFNALFSLVNILMAPAGIVAFALSRTIARVPANAPGELRVIVERSAMIGLAAALAIVVIGSAAAPPLGRILRVEDVVTVVLALILLAGTLLHLVAVGWLQGVMRYVAAAIMLAGIPVLRFLFGALLLMVVGGGVDAALIAAAAPGFALFAAGILAMGNVFKAPRSAPAPAIWFGLVPFVAVGAPATLFLFAFWNIDIVLVRAMFSPGDSGLYAMAAVLARIPFLSATAVVNVLFPETVRVDLSGASTDRLAMRPLAYGLGIAAALGVAAAVVLALLAEPLLVVFAGPAYAPAAALLRVISFAMAALALVQILVTYMLARNQFLVLLPVAIALGAFAALSLTFAIGPLWIAYCLGTTIVVLLAACLGMLFLESLSRKHYRLRSAKRV
jgi:O-antigen/teichoic acid export membrane protein